MRDAVAPDPPAIQNSATIELNSDQDRNLDSAIDSAPLPPVDDVAEVPSPATVDDLNRIERRIGELEHQVASDQGDRAEHQWLPLIERIDDQSQDVEAIALRIEQVERRMESHNLKDQDSAAPISIRSFDENGQSQTVIHARNANLSDLLARLGESAGMNLIISPEVTGNISLHLRGSDAEAVLSAVCKICHFRTSRSGNFVVIYPDAAPVITPNPATSETISKLYRMKHLSGAEIQPFVKPLLTPGLGTCGFAPVRGRMSQTTNPSRPQAILVKDTAQVLAEIDRLVIELDQPPTGDSDTSTPGDLQIEPAQPPLSEPAVTAGESFEPPLTAVNPIRSRD